MKTSRLRSVVKELSLLYSSGTHAGLADNELLATVIESDGETAERAFAAIVSRHGPMVFRVCQRILGDAHLSEDAFQATFITLARKARSLNEHASVGPWLYGVASRVAAKSRAATIRRAKRERRYGEQYATVTYFTTAHDCEFQSILHDELRRLPDPLRVPIVLCYLEGVTREEAAAQLGWPIGTVASRLARGKERLRGRLSRRGVTLSITGLASPLGADLSAAPSTALIERATTKAISVIHRPTAIAHATTVLTNSWSRSTIIGIWPTGSVLGAVVAGVIGAVTCAFVYHSEHDRRPMKRPAIQTITPEPRTEQVLALSSSEELVTAALRSAMKASLWGSNTSTPHPVSPAELSHEKQRQDLIDRASNAQLVSTVLSRRQIPFGRTTNLGPGTIEMLEKLVRVDNLLADLRGPSRQQSRAIPSRLSERGQDSSTSYDFEKVVRDALHNASDLELVEAASRLGNRAAVSLALSLAEEPATINDARLRERIDHAIHDANTVQLLRAVRRTKSAIALRVARSAHDRFCELPVADTDETIEALLDSTPADHLMSAALRLETPDALLLALAISFSPPRPNTITIE